MGKSYDNTNIWDAFYRENVTEEMPWYLQTLDPDLKSELEIRGLKGGKFLDLGTGPGTQASELAKLGFAALGSDISDSAIAQAKKTFPKISFLQDDILESSFPSEHFDFVFDRGCFHVFSQEQRETYIKQTTRILKKNGFLFLKCFSKEESGAHKGPSKFSPAEIEGLFSPLYRIDGIAETVYQGTLSTYPRALFATMRKR